MYKNLNAEISRADISIVELCEDIGITRQAFINKRKDKNEWKLNEMIKIQDYINTKLNTNYSLDYLFQRD